MLPSQDGVVTISLLTVGDSVDGYRMVGIPDGLGRYESRKGTFTVLMNHEIAVSVRAPCATTVRRRFVSRWVIDDKRPRGRVGTRPHRPRRDLEHGHERLQRAGEGRRIGRLCSADPRRPVGVLRQAFEDGLQRAAVPQTARRSATRDARSRTPRAGSAGSSPSLGKFSWENAVANPATGRKTVVFGTDDTTPTGQVYVYVGEKKATGNPAERAGLTGGTLYGIKVRASATEPVNTGVPSGTASRPASLGDVKNMTGAQIETASDALR